jgi:hypothetical protein
MLIAYHDEYGCDCCFDSDLASPQELIEFAAEVAERGRKTDLTMYASGLCAGDDGFVVIVDRQLAGAWWGVAEVV